ncbi:metallophosphoesterase [Parvularcula marina]|uniref:Calcineurin-like phosphoesterase domain-containing protein n=1 Tax=Parvularcula marina TaxID=2292771 RepID=A0A371R870_9PROT|nr:metallophosphoesterase [Parvularcula marina]RFB01661.1 hypothetical protein DX908_15415 [Parvularcula marina]
MVLNAEWIYWGSFLLLPVLAVLLSAAMGGHWLKRVLALIFTVPVALLVYARFVEPQRLIRVATDVEICGQGLPGTIKAAVLSDVHQGIFRNAVSVPRLVKTINRSNPDIVLIAGDFTYDLPPEKFEKTFAAFKHLKAPVYGVLGNHDNIHGPEYREKLIDALEKSGVTMLAPGEDVFRKDGKFIRIVGIRDMDSFLGKTETLGEYPAPGGMPSIVLSHSPEVIGRSETGHYDLMVTGHTHGGQVWIPKVTCELTTACRTWRYGLAETPTGKLFVTSGTGMTALPIRFNMQPRIDILRVQINRCEAQPFGDVMRVFPHDQGSQN